MGTPRRGLPVQAESMSPVCLPAFNPGAFLHAYIHYLHQGSGLAVLLLTGSPDSFFELADARAGLQAQLDTADGLQVTFRAGYAPTRLCAASHLSCQLVAE